VRQDFRLRVGAGDDADGEPAVPAEARAPARTSSLSTVDAVAASMPVRETGMICGSVMDILEDAPEPRLARPRIV
jgi:hypothetical protein